MLRTQNETSGQFRSFNRDLRGLTRQLRASDPDFRRLYADGTRSANALEDVLEANRTALPVLLDNLVSTAQVQQVRLPALRQILVTYPNVVAGGFTVTPGDGTAHFGFVTDDSVPVCTEGYETTTRRSPAETSNPTPNLAAYCSEGDGPSNIRGSRNTPYAKGSAPFPENGGVQSDKAADPGASTAAARRPLRRRRAPASSTRSPSATTTRRPAGSSPRTAAPCRSGRPPAPSGCSGPARGSGCCSARWPARDGARPHRRRPAAVDAPTRRGLQAALGGPVGTGVWALVVIALLVTAVVLGLRVRAADQRADLRADAVQAARQEALNLTSVDATDLDGDLERVLEGASGTFREEFEAQSTTLRSVLQENQVAAEGTVLDAGLARFSEDAATALVVIDSVVRNRSVPDGQTRTYRMQLELERVGDRWLTSSLQFVS